ncbi:MAG: UDP-N-acetylmuramoyl-tripeptide--D-alanyl-D-alanine ligase [Betaproteobacteria bacterium]|nr:UDP-N-acetylmuramoyl-tripeptide--D-alanyl-D-alanine ligase [Betaproteobacteria bacterium]
MMLLSQAAQVLGGRLIPFDGAQGRSRNVLFTTVSSDSRTIVPGDLFVALRGENFDGSEFVAGAAQSGAVAALINAASYRGAESPCPLLLVEDTRLALGRLAAHWREQFAIPLVAVTGSNGKTTVKEMLASILRTAAGSTDAVLATQGNLNNDIGMPLMLLKLRAAHRYAVIEMGMNHPGEIDYLTHLARPDVAIINNAGSAHLAGLGSVEAVARAKGEIFAGLPENGIAVINADDAHAPLWRKLAGAHAVIEFGMERHVAVHAQWLPQGHGAHIEASTPQGGFSANLQVPGVHNVRNALAATAAALALHIPLHDIAAGLEKFSGVGSRLQRKVALHGAVLIDDSYNANPASVHAALKVLAQASGRKILVLGDMGELGAAAVRLHNEIGAEARRLGVNELLALGELTAHTVHEFGAGARHFERIEDLLAALDKDLGAGSTVLVKGSRFMRMERVVRYCTGQEGTCCSH